MALQRRIAETSEALDESSLRFVDDAVRGAPIGGFVPSYVHGDLGVGNFVFVDGEFTGVFDLGGGRSGDPDENLATPLWWPSYWKRHVAAAAFLEGHRSVRTPRPGQDERLRAYVVESMLTNWEVGQRHGFGWYGTAQTFREWAEPFVERIDAMLRRLHRS